MGTRKMSGLVACLALFLSCQSQKTGEGKNAVSECPACPEASKEGEQKAAQMQGELGECKGTLESAGATLQTCQADLAGLKTEAAQNQAACEKATGQCEEKLSAAAKQLAEANEKVAKAEAAFAASTQALVMAEETIKKLKDTPENRLAEFSTLLNDATTLESAEALSKALDQFLLVNAGNQHGKAAQAIKKALSPRLTELRAKAAEEKALQSVSAFRTALASVEDGSELAVSAIVTVGALLKETGLGFDGISALPRAKPADAAKDPESQRGKAMVVKGTVLQITREGDYYTGLIIKMSGYSIDKVYRFIALGSTDGIYEEKTATFAGIFTQRHEYSTRSGGSNEALVLVGYFDGQGN